MLPWAIAAIVLVLASLLARGSRRSIAGGLLWLANRVYTPPPLVVNISLDCSALEEWCERAEKNLEEFCRRLDEGEEGKRGI